ncbi:MAG: Cyclopropane-fatty-acyl-phospholipid synthase [Microgenomates group bacterium GW2011_GWC1_38_14]|nr:MAG: Cyclopropane-fatty-acyl-phospholipid synthase [Microgenomates group bacterium GW2011_GWC1_38_14]
MNYSRVIQEIFSQFKGKKFSVKLWDGQEYFYGTGPLKTFTLVIKNEKTAQRLLAQGALGFGESYMEGRLQIEGDLEAYLRLRHQFKHVRRSLRLALATLLANWSMPRDRKDQIAYHYDLGNDFFQMILDGETMSYSAGRYEKGTEDLAQAQIKKLELVCKWLNLPKGSSVLDLGSGWGGFAKYAAKNKQWNINGYTLSKAQLEYCCRLIKANDLEEFVSFEYRDMIENLPATKFDGVVMIESIEHVGQKKLPHFFNQLHKILKPGGSLVIQLTGRYKSRSVDPWTLKYVFPGGYLPTKDEVISAAALAGFVVEEFCDDTPDYILTITEWIKNLESRRTEVEAKFGKPFYRLWELWMHGAKVAFEVNSMNLFRIRFQCKK